jgi:hypothetical protein
MAVGFRLKRERDPARVRALLELTDRKSLLALRGVGPESEAESVRFHGRRVTKVGPGVKHGFLGCGAGSKFSITNPQQVFPFGEHRCCIPSSSP